LKEIDEVSEKSESEDDILPMPMPDEVK